MWESQTGKPADEYLCVVDNNSNLILHTAHPETVGNNAGKNRITSKIDTPESCLGDLVHSKKDYVGDYISSSGQYQLAAFSHVSNQNWVIGIHRSKQALTDDIKDGLKNSKFGFYLVCFILMPLSWLMIFLTFHFNEKKRRYFEESLTNSEEKYRGLFDDSIAAIYVFDNNKNFIDSNQAGIELLGYSKKELLNMSIPDIDADPMIVLPAHEQLLGGDRIANYEHRLKRKNGEIVTVLNNSKPTIDSEGHVTGMQSTLIDITARKDAEVALKNSEELFRDMVEKLPFPLAVGTVDYKTEYVNPKFMEVFGYTIEEVPDQKAWREKFFPDPEYRVKISNEVNSWIEEGKYLTVFERRYTDKWGRDHDVIITVMNLKERFFNIIEDITERKEVQKEKENFQNQLHQLQKMESIGNLAGGIAHDFNNILFPIIGMSEMLLEDLPPDSLEYDNAIVILEAGKRGSDLVKQILAFSRQSQHKLIPVYIQKILKEVLKLCRSTIPSDIRISSDIQPDCGLVTADETQIHQVAMNLITNAYHAVEETSGKISVTLKETQIDPENSAIKSLVPGEYAVLSVDDTGCGIAPGVIDKIFDPYFTTKDKSKGTGLGLSMVHGIIKDHNGDIQVNSKMGKGSTFNVYLPLMQKETENKLAKKVEVLEVGTETIFLVDDEEAIVQLERKILERLGYNVNSYTSSIEALEAFKADPQGYDLVVTDMTMPNITGDQLAQKILNIRPDIPIIICTGFSERLNEMMAKAIGIKGFLMKPVIKSDLAQMVRKVLDESKNC
jgi:PAS domain S-box-containing protein